MEERDLFRFVLQGRWGEEVDSVLDLFNEVECLGVPAIYGFHDLERPSDSVNLLCEAHHSQLGHKSLSMEREYDFLIALDNSFKYHVHLAVMSGHILLLLLHEAARVYGQIH